METNEDCPGHLIRPSGVVDLTNGATIASAASEQAIEDEGLSSGNVFSLPLKLSVVLTAVLADEG
jgi:hypothetical protein